MLIQGFHDYPDYDRWDDPHEAPPPAVQAALGVEGAVLAYGGLVALWEALVPAAACGNEKVDRLAKGIEEWLGENYRMGMNKYGDKYFISADGTRKIRFDFNHPYPHENVHVNIEQLINGVWQKSPPIYPSGVPHQ